VTAALGLIFIVATAFLAAHLLFGFLGQRFRIVSGPEYLLLGIILGPQVSGLMSADVVEGFTWFTILALGWTGASLGMQLYLPRLLETPGVVYRTAVAEAALAFTVVTAVMAAAFYYAFDANLQRVLLPAVTLGSIAAASASSALPLIATGTHPIAQQVETTAVVDSVLAIFAFGLILCIAHVDVTVGNRFLTPTEWAVISLGVGVVGGTLFHLFIGPERDPDRLFVASAGAVFLGSGAAAYLRLSPIMSALLIGAILINTAPARHELVRVMTSIEKPLYFVLLLLAGASWKPSRYSWLLPVLLFVLVRVAAKLGAARLAARLAGRTAELGLDWGRGLLTQGTLGLAIAMNYSLNDGQLVPNIVFTAAVASVLVNDLFGARLLSALTGVNGKSE
jgi:Kef-type K+ transport system membrane component KefB